jgi:hypothetical protein
MMALLDLPSKDPTIREAMAKLNEWLTRPEKYAKVPLPTEILTARLPKAHINLMEKHGKAERSPAGSVPKSTCKVFTTAEPAKERERLIEHPIDINDATIGDLEKTTFLPQEERHNALLLGDDTVTVDADCAAWFDQVGLAQEVRDFFTFMWRGQAWRLKVLPMGMRHSVAIAHTATRQLLNFDWGSVWVEPYVDNIRFCGKREEVERVVAEFFARCKKVGVTLNEVDVNEAGRPEEAIKMASILVKREGDWLGERYNFVDHTIAATARTLDKVRGAAELVKPTWRNFAARVSLLRYASNTLGLGLSFYYASLRAYASAARMLSGHPEKWDDLADAPQPHVLSSLARWTEDVLSAPPRKITVHQQPTATLITDASDAGYGAIDVDAIGSLQAEAFKWSKLDRERGTTKKSVYAEPEAVCRSIRRFVNPSNELSLVVLTDSSTAALAIRKGYSPAFLVNSVCSRIVREFPRLTLTLKHIPGATNPADGLSRGHSELTVEEWATALAMAKESTGVEYGVSTRLADSPPNHPTAVQ